MDGILQRPALMWEMSVLRKEKYGEERGEETDAILIISVGLKP